MSLHRRGLADRAPRLSALSSCPPVLVAHSAALTGPAGQVVGVVDLIALSGVIAPIALTGLNAASGLRGSSGLAEVSALVAAVPALIALIAASVLLPVVVAAVRGPSDLIVVSASRVQVQDAVIVIAAMGARSAAFLHRVLVLIDLIVRIGLSAMSGGRASHLLLRVPLAQKSMI